MLYWTDWGTTPPRIETASYDGSDRKILVNYTGLSIGGFDIDTRGNGVSTLSNTKTEPIQRPIKNGLYRSVWRYSYCKETDTNIDSYWVLC